MKSLELSEGQLEVHFRRLNLAHTRRFTKRLLIGPRKRIGRGIAACDIIDFDVETTYWHTPQDTLEKVDPSSLSIVGRVFLETVPELEKKAP